MTTIPEGQHIDEQDTAAIAQEMSTTMQLVNQLRFVDNDFAKSLCKQWDRKRHLSDKQLWAAERMLDRMTKPAAAKVDLTPIREMFETAVSNGYKKPAYRAEGLVINRAPDYGNNPGALYVKNDDAVYGGKVLGTEFLPVYAANAADFATYTYEDENGVEITVSRTAIAALVEIAKAPLEAALRYGQRTGQCACCGRLLTNHISIDLGIGPICRAKWGL